MVHYRLAHLREHGLRPQDVRAIPAAAGGPKGLVLNPLDRYLFGLFLILFYGDYARPYYLCFLA